MIDQKHNTLQLNSVCKFFGSHQALDNLSISIAPGEIYALLGPNGAGKTTTLNLILGFISADKGDIALNGEVIKKNSPQARKSIAYLPETVMLPPGLTAIESLIYFSLLSGKKINKQDASRLLEESGLHKNDHQRCTDRFSKGMRQKVGLAIAVAKNASLLLLDEPTSGLDASAANELSYVIRAASSRGIAVLMATHDLYRVKDVAHRLGILRSGALLQEREVQNLSAADIEKLYLEQLAA